MANNGELLPEQTSLTSTEIIAALQTLEQSDATTTTSDETSPQHIVQGALFYGVRKEIARRKRS